MSPRRSILTVFLPLAVLTLLLAPWIGGHGVPLSTITQLGSSHNLDAIILWQIRIPRMLLAMVAGMGLSLGGLVFQAIFRNPLATPFTLGVAGGASFGVTLSLVLGISFSVLGISGISLAALLGAFLSIALVYLISRATGNASPHSMLLGGVAISFFFSSLILLFQYLGDISDTFRIIHWLMGDLSRASYDTVLQTLPFVISGVLICGTYHKELNLLIIHDDLATSYGLQVERSRMILFFAISLMVAGIITTCGPIGFVGIIAPHICRLVVGNNHRHLIPATIIFGGTFLTICDTVARSISSSAEVPVGIITALLGGPFFVWLLIQKKKTH